MQSYIGISNVSLFIISLYEMLHINTDLISDTTSINQRNIHKVTIALG